MPRPVVRALAFFGLALAFLLSPARAGADQPAPAPSSWGGELQSVAEWLAQRNQASVCTEHCFVLTKLHLTGAAGGEMHFALEGAVLSDKPVAVPLFGPPEHAHIDRVLENGKPAAVGFERDHWFVLTAARHFVVEGSLTLDGDLALTLPGPLDALEADLSRGRVVEGSHLSGLMNATVHLDQDAASSPAEEPPVFQLSRAVRIGRETTFEYRLVMRSGKDLGVVRLPLALGEKVLDVQGSTGWTLQGTDLVLPTAGRSAQVTVTGALPSVSKLEPDARSSYEWWLIESDAEHRLGVKGDARQVDASQSPIARSQPSARLFMVARGQHLDVDAQALVATEALAAVVREHDRTLVLTARGDLVADDVLNYENDGIDWLAWPPTGRAVFLATDGRAERVMRAAEGAGEVLVPLREGSHSVHLQSMSSAALSPLAGWLSVPTPTHALATSRATLTLGLPGNVHPLAVLGGDHPWLAFGAEDALALAMSLVLALVLLRGRLRRALGAAALGGLWLAAPSLWTLGVGAALLTAAAWAAARLLPRGPRWVAWSALGVAALVAGGMAMSHRDRALQSGPARPVEASPQSAPVGTVLENQYEQNEDLKKEASKATTVLPQRGQAFAAGKGGVAQALLMGEENGRDALGGVVMGVAPVALPMPAYQRSVVITRELVTRDRPLSLSVLYVTTTGLVPFALAWLACILLLARLHAAQLGRAVRAVRERLMRAPEPEPPPPAPAAPPPVVA